MSKSQCQKHCLLHIQTFSRINQKKIKSDILLTVLKRQNWIRAVKLYSKSGLRSWAKTESLWRHETWNMASSVTSGSSLQHFRPHLCEILSKLWKSTYWITNQDNNSEVSNFQEEPGSHIFHAAKLQLYLYCCTNIASNHSRKGDTYLLYAVTKSQHQWQVTDPRMAEKRDFINTTSFKLPLCVCVGAWCLVIGGTNACMHTHTRVHTHIISLSQTNVQQSNESWSHPQYW